MEVENFYQCLQYIEAAKSNSYWEKLLPLISACAGASLAFAYNYFNTSSQANKALKNKLMCCNEGVERTSAALEHIVKELLKIMTNVLENKNLEGNHLPKKLTSLYLEKFHADVSHKYSKEQRTHVESLLRSLEPINENLKNLGLGVINRYEYSLFLLNTVTQATASWRHAQAIINDTSPKTKSVTESVIEMGGTNENLESMNKLSENAFSGNTKLAL